MSTGLSILVEEIEKPHAKDFLKYEKNINSIIRSYYGKYADRLSTRGPSKRLPFSDVERLNLCNAAGISRAEVRLAMKKCKSINPKWKILGDDFVVLCAVLAHFYYDRYINTKEAHFLKTAENVTFFLTARLHGGLQFRQFKYEPSEEVMNYTIEHLSNKFYIKKMASMYEVLEMVSKTNVENMGEKLESGQDPEIIFFVTNLYSRLNSLIKNISVEFYRNHEAGRKLYADNIMKEDDTGEKYIDSVKTVSADVEAVTRKIVHRMIADALVDQRLVKIAAARTGVSKDKISSTLKLVQHSDDPLVQGIVQDVLSYYLKDHQVNEIRSANFIKIMEKIYTVSNTKDDFVLGVKDKLDSILKKYSAEYLKTNRAATLGNMRLCVYLYIILYIARYVE